MRLVRRLLLTAALGAASAGGAAAQSVGTQAASTGGGGLAAASSGLDSSSSGSGGLAGSSTGSSVGGGQSGSSTQAASTPKIAGGDIGAVASTTTASGGVISTSNFLGGTYANPYNLGLYSNSANTPGGFGTLLFGAQATGTTSSGATGVGSAARINAASTTARTGLGGAAQASRGGAAGGGAGGFGGAAASPFGGQVIPLPRNIAYQAVLRFPTPAVAPAQRLADVQARVASATLMTNPAGVTVVADGGVLVLRGQVASEDEARLAEGMVRLTPGVREVRNELTFPSQ